jgi:5-methylcytosine-specific restriction protein B
MMNTADRSLALIDYALRRRFSFFEMEPGFNSDGFKKYQADFHNETFDTLIDHVKDLNKAIYSDDSLGPGFRIGHSYFCGQTECSDEWMREVVYYDLLPMLQEYWFDDKRNLREWENKLTGVFDD